MSKEKSFFDQKDNTINTNLLDKPLFPIEFSEKTKTKEIFRRTKVLLNKTEDYNNYIFKFNKYKNSINKKSKIDRSSIGTYKNKNKIYLKLDTKEFTTNNQNNLNSEEYTINTISTRPRETYNFNTSIISNSNSHGNFPFKNSLKFTHTSIKFNGNDKINHEDNKSKNKILLKKANRIKYRNNSVNVLPDLRKNQEKKSFLNLIPELNVDFDIFNRPRYHNLSYDPHNIGNNDKEYFNMLKEKIDEMKNSLKFEIEEKSILNKKYKQNGKRMNLTLHSIILEFIYPNGLKNPIKVYLPFCLLPLFYFNQPEDIKYLLMSLIEFSENFEEVNFNYQKMYNFVIFSDKYDTNKTEILLYSKGKFNKNIYDFKWITPIYDIDVCIR